MLFGPIWRGMGYRRVLVPAVLFCSSLALSIFLAEAVFRIWEPRLAPVSRELLWGHIRDPNSRWGETAGRDYRYHPSIGYVRPAAVAELKNANGAHEEIRILILGDSVSEHGWYATQLTSLLNSAYPAQMFRVLNTGTTGYDTELEAKFLQAYGKVFQPDIIVLQFHVNDFMSTPVIVPSGDSWIAYDRNLFGSLFDLPGIRDSRLFRFCVVAVFDLLHRYNVKLQRSYFLGGDEIVRAPLEKIVSFAKGSDSLLRILVIPEFGVAGSPIEIHGYAGINRIIQGLGIGEAVIDLFPRFTEETLSEISINQGHPNQRGHEIISEALFRNLRPEIDQLIRMKFSNRDSS